MSCSPYFKQKGACRCVVWDYNHQTEIVLMQIKTVFTLEYQYD